jgi:hypothetical protein
VLSFWSLLVVVVLVVTEAAEAVRVDIGLRQAL